MISPPSPAMRLLSLAAHLGEPNPWVAGTRPLAARNGVGEDLGLFRRGGEPPIDPLSVIGLFKAEVIQRRGPWRSLEAVEFATLTWVDWFNTRRLLEPIGYLPPAEYEARYYEQAAVA